MSMDELLMALDNLKVGMLDEKELTGVAGQTNFGDVAMGHDAASKRRKLDHDLKVGTSILEMAKRAALTSLGKPSLAERSSRDAIRKVFDLGSKNTLESATGKKRLLGDFKGG